MEGTGAGFVQNEAIDESELQSEAKQNHSEHEVSIAIHGHGRNSGCESSVGGQAMLARWVKQYVETKWVDVACAVEP